MTQPASPTSRFSQLSAAVSKIGEAPGLDEAALLRRRLLVYMGLLMSGGGVLWGTIALSQGLIAASVIPYGYVVLTAFNLVHFKKSLDFERTRFFQVLISLLLPFLFQISLGGFASSGVVMLWSMLAIVGALTFSTSRHVVFWLVMYSCLTIVTGLADPWAREVFRLDTSPDVRVLFTVMNVVIISGIVFGLTVSLLARQESANAALEKANQEVTELNERLEALVAMRTRDLRATLAQMRTIIDNMPNALVALSSDGVVQASNRTLESLFALGSSPTGRQAAEVLPKVLSELMQRSMTMGTEETVELPLPDGRVGVAAAGPMRADGEGEILGCVVIVRDVTLEKEVDRMKTDFIATVSHELRTPLTSVLGFAKVTRTRLDSVLLPALPRGDPRVERAVHQVLGNLGIIVSEGERLTSLISDVLDISKMEAGRVEWKREPIDPAELVKRAAAASTGLFAESKIQLVTEVDTDLPTITGDFDRLLQVLINLISNSAKFTERGTVTVSARSTAEGVAFCVRDTGAGIPVGDRVAIFERFRQGGDALVNKPKGTGLGLPISQQIVTAHGGKIEVASEIGVGSAFSFVLSATDRPAVAHSPSLVVSRVGARVKAALPVPTGKQILVVDDNANLRELLRQQLVELGYNVLQAAGGLEGVRVARLAHPDLIILDIMMPDVNGFDVAAMLKSDPNTSAIPIVVLTIVEDAERGYRIGVDSYVRKPHDIRALAEEIQRVLADHAGSRRAMVVSDESERPRLTAEVESEGYTVVGACGVEACSDMLQRCQPDLVLVDAKNPEAIDLLHRARRQSKLEHGCIIRLNAGVLSDRGVTHSDAGEEGA